MKKFTYWLNKSYWHEKTLFECEEESIIDADKKFYEATGIKPEKVSYIGCTITETAQ